jgi:RNA-directed DNA polymerase
METWSTHLLFQESAKEHNKVSALDIQKYANNLRSINIPVLFSLGHLSKITDIDYIFLHDTVNRRRETANYNLFAISKRSGGRRFIHAVNGRLFYLQKFINNEILQKIKPHASSYAFHQSGGIRQCASVHCGCKWLFQFDLKDFFYSISEPDVYLAFLKMGYKRLLSFELARLCTTLRLPQPKRNYIKHHRYYPNFDLYDSNENLKGAGEYPYKPQSNIGVLPQGAPTSPMVSNIVATKLDESLYHFAQLNGFVYTRYADDLTFSASVLPEKKSIGQLKREIISLIRKNGFRENNNKTRIAGPGSKKVVLGLLVDGGQPRVSRELLKRIDRNLYSIEKHGLEKVASHDGFESPYGFYNHVSGLMSYIKDVDHICWKKYEQKFRAIREKYNEKNT